MPRRLIKFDGVESLHVGYVDSTSRTPSSLDTDLRWCAHVSSHVRPAGARSQPAFLAIGRSDPRLDDCARPDHHVAVRWSPDSCPWLYHRSGLLLDFMG